MVAAEIEITEDLPREPVLAPVWLLVRLQGWPASRVYVPAGQSIAGVLETQLEEPLRRYL